MDGGTADAIAQLVEHRMHYLKVAGQIPADSRCVFFMRFNSLSFMS